MLGHDNSISSRISYNNVPLPDPHFVAFPNGVLHLRGLEIIPPKSLLLAFPNGVLDFRGPEIHPPTLFRTLIF